MFPSRWFPLSYFLRRYWPRWDEARQTGGRPIVVPFHPREVLVMASSREQLVPLRLREQTVGFRGREQLVPLRGREVAVALHPREILLPVNEGIMPSPLIKYDLEAILLDFNFSAVAEIVAGQTLTGTPTVTSTPSGLTIGVPSISGSKVVFQCSGGTPNVTYNLSCAVLTSGGSTIAGSAVLFVEKA